MTKKNLVLAVLFVLANVAAVSATSALTHDGARGREATGRALAAEHYEDATDAALDAAYADSPVVCVAAATPSGCR